MRYLVLIVASLLAPAGCLAGLNGEGGSQQDKAQPTRFHQDIAWSPDGKRISFSALEGDNWDVFVMDADGSHTTRLTKEAAADRYTTWSPDGKRLAFSSNREGGQDDIYTMNADGTGVTRLTHDPARDTFPAWSPDGKRIAFVSSREGTLQLYVMGADGSNQVRLTKIEGGVYNPVWSPDGSRLVFYADKGDKKDQIWVVRGDGSGLTLVTGGVGHNIFPSWSPGGRKILLSSDRDGSGRTGVYEIAVDGAHLAPIPGVESFFARWSPDGKRLAYIAGKYPATEIRVIAAGGDAPAHP